MTDRIVPDTLTIKENGRALALYTVEHQTSGGLPAGIVTHVPFSLYSITIALRKEVSPENQATLDVARQKLCEILTPEQQRAEIADAEAYLARRTASGKTIPSTFDFK